MWTFYTHKDSSYKNTILQKHNHLVNCIPYLSNETEDAVFAQKIPKLHLCDICILAQFWLFTNVPYVYHCLIDKVSLSNYWREMEADITRHHTFLISVLYSIKKDGNYRDRTSHILYTDAPQLLFIYCTISHFTQDPLTEEAHPPYNGCSSHSFFISAQLNSLSRIFIYDMISFPFTKSPTETLCPCGHKAPLCWRNSLRQHFYAGPGCCTACWVLLVLVQAKWSWLTQTLFLVKLDAW